MCYGIKVKWSEKDKDLLQMIIGPRQFITCDVCKEVSHTTHCPQIGPQVHVRKFHESECSKMPTEMFSENNRYRHSLKPESYLCLVKPSPKESSVAVNMRVLVLQWPERLGPKASKTKEVFLEDWQMDDCSVQFSSVQLTLDKN